MHEYSPSECSAGAYSAGGGAASPVLPAQSHWRERYPLAAPSWVIPGGIPENAFFLSGRVDEVALCFFELQSCLEYSEADLPPGLSGLPLSWHVHLPFDLPFTGRSINSRAGGAAPDSLSNLPGGPRNNSGAGAAEAALLLMRKVDFLKPAGAVLHTPPKAVPAARSRRILRDFVEVWQQDGRRPEDLWLENTRDSDLLEFEDVIVEYGLSVCLDIGHVLAYKQNALLRAQTLLSRIKLVHFSLPGQGAASGRHLPFSPDTVTYVPGMIERLDFLPDFLRRLKPGTRLLPEIFSWQGYVDSAVFLDKYFRECLSCP